MDSKLKTRQFALKSTAPSDRKPTTRITLLAGLLLVSLAGTVSAQIVKEIEDVSGQGMGGPVVSPGGATLMRFDTGLNVGLRMPTPEPGTYSYPPGNAFNPDAEMGHPEAFSLWVFVFNNPDDCDSVPCTITDFAAGRGSGGAFNAGGHVVGGSTLQLSGRVSLTSEPFMGSPLLEPQTAEVHLAVAPHGAVQPEFMPNQIKTPIGNPNDHWWLAIFLP